MFLFCLVFAMSLCASVFMCFVVTCWEKADPPQWLSFVVSNCEFVTFPLVSWVRCGAPDLCTLTYFGGSPERSKLVLSVWHRRSWKSVTVSETVTDQCMNWRNFPRGF